MDPGAESGVSRDFAHGSKIVAGERAAEQEALHHAAVVRAQELFLAFGFHAFGHLGELEVVPQADDRLFTDKLLEQTAAACRFNGEVGDAAFFIPLKHHIP